MIEGVTIKWVTGSSKLKNNGETTIDRFSKSSPAFENKYAIIRNKSGKSCFFLLLLFFFCNNRINVESRILT